jgi:hypothetical protein
MGPVRGLALASCLLALSAAAWPAEGACRFEAPRQGKVDAKGATRAHVVARAGSLTITGEAGLTEVQASGTACAGSEADLEKVRLRVDRAGDEVRVEVETPTGWHGSGSLDLEVRVPKDLALNVEDGSGSTEIDGVASLRLKDGSGGIDVRGVTGRLEIDDGSGGIHVRDVSGDVEVHDGSGEMDVRQVGGSITVEDGSGGIEIHDVTGLVTITEDGSGGIRIERVRRNVLVERDGSGSIEVDDVGGDFTVEHGGSGSIHHTGVKGRVQIPSR